MTDKITVGGQSYEAWVQSREQYAIGTNCGWCGRGLPGGAPPLIDRIVVLEVELEAAKRDAEDCDLFLVCVEEAINELRAVLRRTAIDAARKDQP